MSEFEFWKDIGNISDAILNYQKKNAEFNNRYINPWLRLGNLAVGEDRSSEIARAYQHAAEIDPYNVQNWIDLGDEHLKLSNWEEAVPAYRKAVELSPRAGWPMSNLALSLVMLGKVEEAIPLYIASVDLLDDNKDKAVSMNRLGEAYRKLNDYEKAFLSFQKADRLEGKIPSPSAAVEVPQEAPSPAAVEEVVVEEAAAELSVEEEDDDGDDNPLANFEKNFGQNDEPEYVQVVDDLPVESSTIENESAEPVDEAPIRDNGIIPSWLSEEHKSSLKPFADENKGKRIPEWLVIDSKEDAREAGEIYISEEDAKALSDQFKGQLEAYAEEQVLAADEESLGLADFQAVRNSPADSSTTQKNELAYEEYLKDVVEPTSILSDHVAEIQSQTPQGKLSKDGEALMALETKSAQVWNELGNIYMKSGSFDDAIASYSKAIELERPFAWPYSNLALAYVQKGYFAEAILLYQRSLELFHTDKDKAVTWNRLGNVYRRLNDYNNAMAAYQTADELDPENATQSLRSSFGLLGNLYSGQKPNYVS
ncbi:MAG: tetratricopeptide repeat protein [Chloroflexi bacterium]|nr:tetratricopeptide repeat protein [Chloroflexota bacterium]